MREGDLSAYGSIDGGPRKAITQEYLINEVYAEPVMDLIGPDPLAFERGEYPDGLHTFRNVSFLKQDFLASKLAKAKAQELTQTRVQIPASKSPKTDPRLEQKFERIFDIADRWSVDVTAPGTSSFIRKILIDAICNGAFFRDGLGIQVHALLLAFDREHGGGGYNPYRPSAKKGPDGSIEIGPPDRLPDLEIVPDQNEFLDYFDFETGALSLSVLSRPEAFFDWLKNVPIDQLPPSALRTLEYVALSKRSFRNWCLASGNPIPKFLNYWPENDWVEIEGETVLEDDEYKPKTTVAAVRRCVAWLVGMMQKGPPLQSKLDYQRAALKKFSVNKRQFKNAWEIAKTEVGNPSWWKPGPKTTK